MHKNSTLRFANEKRKDNAHEVNSSAFMQPKMTNVRNIDD